MRKDEDAEANQKKKEEKVYTTNLQELFDFNDIVATVEKRKQDKADEELKQK